MLHNSTAAKLDESIEVLRKQYQTLLDLYTDPDTLPHIRRVADENMETIRECILFLNERMRICAEKVGRPVTLV